MTFPSSARDDEGRPPPGSSPTLVLVNPQDIVNIASAVRIARNFGIARMRLVDPEVFDPWRIEGIAHNTADFVARIEILPTLEAALADCTASYVLTGRERAAKRTTLRPREAAAAVVRDLAAGPVAIVAGREDSGLTNAELDRCGTLVTISTDPSHPSLNLAQAVAIMAYEIWTARGGDAQPLKPPRREAGPATAGQLAELFEDWHRALWAIDFFKTRRSDSVMRSWREIVHRARLDGREASLVRAMGIEVSRYLQRVGAPFAGAPPQGGAGGPGETPAAPPRVTPAEAPRVTPAEAPRVTPAEAPRSSGSSGPGSGRGPGGGDISQDGGV
ncbi:MAG TPA: TrmH family RNA methyltransferase [Gemmatimonadales bacterium]|nr:TrmH family RNA methyltransferase [Gemmatimonadales bacterium]